MPGFTISVPNLVSAGAVIPCHFAVSGAHEAALKVAGIAVPAPIPVFALIDTGATKSAIEQGLAAKLSIQPTGTTMVSTASAQGQECLTYAARLHLPKGTALDGFHFTELPVSLGAYQCLIGRDVLSKGMLTYIGNINQFTLMF